MDMHHGFRESHCDTEGRDQTFYMCAGPCIPPFVHAATE